MGNQRGVDLPFYLNRLFVKPFIIQHIFEHRFKGVYSTQTINKDKMAKMEKSVRIN